MVAFLDAVPEDVLVVVDEAYVEFVTDPERVRGLDLVAERPNVVVLRTFSKAYGLAGFRVGYGVASPEIAAAVRAVALPFGVSVPAQAAVVASLEAEPALLERVAHLVTGPGGAGDGLRELGFAVPEAQGNFVWLPCGTAHRGVRGGVRGGRAVGAALRRRRRPGRHPDHRGRARGERPRAGGGGDPAARVSGRPSVTVAGQ